MTEEDKKLIADYMGWEIRMFDWWKLADCGLIRVLFDLNDAGVCVKEMKKRGDDYVEFIKVAYDMAFDEGNMQFHTVMAWLYDRDNFFKAMTAWLKGGGKQS